MIHILYVVPVHNDAGTLPTEIEKLTAELAKRPQRFDVLLAENGSSDDSADVTRSLAGESNGIVIRACSCASAGIGYGYDLGIQEGLAAGAAADAWFLLTASDLPFGSSDLDAFVPLIEREPSLRIAIGSKAHPSSRITGRAGRKLASFVYRGLRAGVIGMRTRDSQGTVLVRADVVRDLAAQTHARGFFYSTELVYWAEHAGLHVHEVPVTLREEVRPSTVRIGKHASQMLRELWALRMRGGMLHQ